MTEHHWRGWRAPQQAARNNQPANQPKTVPKKDARLRELKDSVAGYRRQEGEFVLSFNYFIEYYLTSAPCCVDLTTGKETNTSNLSRYLDLVKFTRPNADNDVGGGGLARCYHLHCEDYDDEDHDDDDDDNGIRGIGGGTTTTASTYELSCIILLVQSRGSLIVLSPPS